MSKKQISTLEQRIKQLEEENSWLRERVTKLSVLVSQDVLDGLDKRPPEQWQVNKDSIPSGDLDTIDILGLPGRVRNVLMRSNIRTLSSLLEFIDYYDLDGLLGLHTFGLKALDVLRETLLVHGYITYSRKSVMEK